jgi:hypothetical protein
MPVTCFTSLGEFIHKYINYNRRYTYTVSDWGRNAWVATPYTVNKLEEISLLN